MSCDETLIFVVIPVGAASTGTVNAAAVIITIAVAKQRVLIAFMPNPFTNFSTPALPHLLLQ